MGALNLGDQMCDPNPSVFREKLGVEGSLIIVSHWAGSRVYGTSESQFFLHVLMWLFSHLCNV